MTNPNWKPQPGKPAMTRDGEMLVTDLEKSLRASRPWISVAHLDTWRDDGGWNIDGSVSPRDLIEPTAAILAAHGIDADGKPVASPPGTFSDGGKSWEPDAPAPSTRVDDRWFEAAKDFTSAVIVAEGMNNTDPSFDTGRAARYADALMAEVAKREGR